MTIQEVRNSHIKKIEELFDISKNKNITDTILANILLELRMMNEISTARLKNDTKRV
jgi:hypothetical protein